MSFIQFKIFLIFIWWVIFSWNMYIWGNILWDSGHYLELVFQQVLSVTSWAGEVGAKGGAALLILGVRESSSFPLDRSRLSFLLCPLISHAEFCEVSKPGSRDLCEGGERRGAEAWRRWKGKAKSVRPGWQVAAHPVCPSVIVSVPQKVPERPGRDTCWNLAFLCQGGRGADYYHLARKGKAGRMSFPKAEELRASEFHNFPPRFPVQLIR